MGIVFTLVIAALLFVLPRRWAAPVFLMGICYMPAAQELEIGALHFPMSRILVSIGFLRIMARRERVEGGMNTLDRLMLWWSVWAVVSSLFHVAGEQLMRLGMVYTFSGTYFLFRIFVQDVEDLHNVFKSLCIILVPVAASMLVEKNNRQEFLRVSLARRRGWKFDTWKFRAQGSSLRTSHYGRHLRGPRGWPMALLLWRKNRNLALIGTAAACGIVFASGSSGPVMTVLTILLGMGLWQFRSHMKTIRWTAVGFIILLNFVMNDPVYYLIARIDITGGSTGLASSENLIDAAIQHFSRWWLIGTDYTRDWMPSGVPWNVNHTDITNEYLAMGVWGGLPLMLLFMGIVWAAFKAVGNGLAMAEQKPPEQQFLIWTLGAALFGHAVNFLSISYYDQSEVFLFLLLASIGGLQAIISASDWVPEESSARPAPAYEADLYTHC